MTTFILITQLVFNIIIGMYFFTQMKRQSETSSSVKKDGRLQLTKLKKLEEVKLTTPLSELTRPDVLNEIIGQEKGLKALRAVMCSKNPQHVIIYGPPGVGKTAAARVVLEEAKKNESSPFTSKSKFIEIDATTVQQDEKGFADPLIGSVHDPIYQGAGNYGPAGIPQPKPGAVTRAHGGILFIDEIGELNPYEMNKLLKVLEDRRVYFESAYYNAADTNTPDHIHEIFKKGLPADFRLIGATTRNPEELPPALRSRCAEIYFKPLDVCELMKIAENAAEKCGVEASEEALQLAAIYAANGRDAVNIIQTAESIAFLEKRSSITKKDIEWVVEFGKYSPHLVKSVADDGKVGMTNGLAVFGSSYGAVIDIEATAVAADKGSVNITGIIEHEEFETRGQRLSRKSTAAASVENIMTLLSNNYNLKCDNYKIHINIPGCAPVDGPSAGVATFFAVYSALTGIAISGKTAMTGEITIKGEIKPVGEVPLKIEAAIRAGVTKIIIPKDNYQEIFSSYSAEIFPVSTIDEAFTVIFGEQTLAAKGI